MNSSIILSVDASKGEDVCGLGYTISGEHSESGCKYLVGEYTSMEAEFHALVEGLRIASQRSETREMVTVYTDCEPLKRKMCSSEQDRDDWEEYRQSARWLLNKFDKWEVKHIKRGDNKDAHDLARKALNRGRHSR